MKFPRLNAAVLAVLLPFAGQAGPALTTIQDTLFKADGTRFNGTLTILWNSFEAADLSNITTQNVTVKVIDGNLRVQLVPTTNAHSSAVYLVKYNSDGKVQFSETWNVAPSVRPMRVRDVRLSTYSAPLQPTIINEVDVSGLTADLEARPIKGAGFSPRRAAVINIDGELDAVSGNLSDCVRVDGTSGACGGTSPGFADAETPGGLVDGANVTFTLAGTPNPPVSLSLHRNGIYQKAGFDFNLTGNAITFVPGGVPQPGDTLMASYRVAGGSTGSLTAPAWPVVICNGEGSSTGSDAFAVLGSCTVTTQPGQRVEIRFDYAHTGNGNAEFQVAWGDTVVESRSSDDAQITGRGEASVVETGTQIAYQTWGGSLPLKAGLVSAAAASPVKVEFRGRLDPANAGTLTLRNYTVLSYAAQ